MSAASRQVLLTFDVEGLPGKEDFITAEIISALYNVLKLLGKYDLKGLFFITGTVAEKIACYPQLLELLNNHEIGYHSSSHSVKPRIFEYTDIRNYEKAVEISKQRETSSIDPSTGSITGPGGILYLREIFPKKKIISFRAPFLSWSPPHLEALRELGFKFDFSASLSNVPVSHKDITFMPFPTVIDSISLNFHVFLKKILSEKFIVFLVHPSQIIFKLAKSSCGHIENVSNQNQIKRRAQLFIQSKFYQLELFFLALRRLQRNKLIKIVDLLEESGKLLEPEILDVTAVYEKSVWAPKNLFEYYPKFLRSHFYKFLEP